MELSEIEKKTVEKKRQERHLIKFDLDGTILVDYTFINPRIKTIIKQMIEDGHRVCFSSGRNYFSVLRFYEEAGLNTYLSSYNGAYIRNPSNENSAVIVNPIFNKIIKQILNEPVFKEKLKNILINRVDLVPITSSDDKYFKKIFLQDTHYLKTDNPLKVLGSDDALQLVLEFPKCDNLLNKILLILNKKFRRTVSFFFPDDGYKLKEDTSGGHVLVRDPDSMIVNIRSKSASKGKEIL